MVLRLSSQRLYFSGLRLPGPTHPDPGDPGEHGGDKQDATPTEHSSATRSAQPTPGMPQPTGATIESQIEPQQRAQPPSDDRLLHVSIRCVGEWESGRVRE